MSETEKKSKQRKERGLNVRVVQEQKDKKPDGVKVNTRVKKTRSRKKTTKKVEIKIDKKVEKKAGKKVEEKINKKVETKVDKKEPKSEIKITRKAEKVTEDNLYSDLAWKKEEPKEKFETLKIHIDKSKTEPRVILRDVAREKPLETTHLVRELPKVQPKGRTSESVRAQKVAEPVIIKPKLSAKEVKEQEIEKAVKVATKLPSTSKKSSRRSRLSGNFGAARAVLAVACLSTAVFAIVYFVNLNSSDISIKVAAMQSGIEAIYPSYIPRDYTLADVTSASGKVTMKFKSESGSYTITEEETDWNSDGLLSNFVKPTFGDEYSVVKEQGLTLYMGDRWEAWVNGGMLYKLTVDSGSLTKKQMKTISTSM